MKTRGGSVLAAIVVVATTTMSGSIAFAATTKGKAPANISDLHEFTVDVPQGQVLHSQVLPDTSGPATQFELAVSSWAPARLDIRDDAGLVSGSFQSQGIPSFEANFISPVFPSWRIGQLSLRLGLGAYPMHRDGVISLGDDITEKETQKLYLFPARLGLEFEPAFASTWIGAPYLQAALMPTLAVAPRSGLSDPMSLTGLPFEFGAGYAFKPRFLRPLSQLNAGVVMTTGSLQGNDLYGVGFIAGARVDL